MDVPSALWEEDARPLHHKDLDRLTAPATAVGGVVKWCCRPRTTPVEQEDGLVLIGKVHARVEETQLKRRATECDECVKVLLDEKLRIVVNNSFMRCCLLYCVKEETSKQRHNKK